jgi:hypothetical protein
VQNLCLREEDFSSNVSCGCADVTKRERAKYPFLDHGSLKINCIELNMFGPNDKVINYRNR